MARRSLVKWRKAQLEAQGIRVITISKEDPRSATLAAFMPREGYSFDYYGDIEGSAARALDANSYPSYLVIDCAGRE